MTNFGGDAAYDGGSHPGPRGVMGNAQTHLRGADVGPPDRIAALSALMVDSITIPKRSRAPAN